MAGMTHVHGGDAKAFGYCMFKDIRHIDSNFLSLCPQQEILIDQLTPEAHIKFLCLFLGFDRSKIEDKV